MPRQPHPIDSRGMPYIPLSIRQFSCGGFECGRNLSIQCPDEHHPFGRLKRAETKQEKDFIKAVGTVSLLRCQHNELHALYDLPDFPEPEVMIQEIRRKSST